ncbi:MAG: polymorphic toxin-type HINT domain-containing protein [Clostridia bacterium]
MWRGWVGAASLHEDMEIWLADGTKTTVEAIGTEELDETTPVYNFEVKDFHTYYVVENSMLVHNEYKPYNELRQDIDETGQQAHHVVEKRLAGTLDVNPNTTLCILIKGSVNTTFMPRSASIPKCSSMV